MSPPVPAAAMSISSRPTLVSLLRSMEPRAHLRERTDLLTGDEIHLKNLSSFSAGANDALVHNGRAGPRALHETAGDYPAPTREDSRPRSR